MDCFLKFESMKLELLVIVGHNTTVNSQLRVYTLPVTDREFEKT